MKNNFMLVHGYVSGTNCFDIYQNYCDVFGWKRSLCNNFAQQKPMYAKNATPEGYSVWMNVHNNLSEAYNEKHGWFNYFIEDTTKEIWLTEPTNAWYHDLSSRVTFAHTKRGYEFQGIYIPIGEEFWTLNNVERPVRIYKRVSTTYPETLKGRQQHAQELKNLLQELQKL